MPTLEPIFSGLWVILVQNVAQYPYNLQRHFFALERIAWATMHVSPTRHSVWERA